MIDRVVREIIAEQAQEESEPPEPAMALQAHVSQRIGGQQVVFVPEDKSIAESFNDGTYYETERAVDLEDWR